MTSYRGIVNALNNRGVPPARGGVIVLGACGLEAAQLLTADRDGRIAEALVKAAGALAVVVIGLILHKARPDRVAPDGELN